MEALSKKGTPAPARTGTGAGTARSALVTRPPATGQVFDPVSGAQIRGQLLSGVRSQQHDQYQRDERGENQLSHGDTLLCC